ncbi:bifunctional hydroxymethylpyrimidine kinase/phosphomethylpyrimidine kinase [Riemerella anatipestifer]|uniref:bifunctional hydroxymethylpyrimidine kinase/phosphomethylpyrimidine kinase n=1 Tax=Riemerella anatipestifer TaxID=34085 RepID=UPI00069B2B6C|nr:bifunctional hydroxymethylpyrimidine kinase/phosphomethylpyrimidine kinase [Riemerella anatipestifer]
MRIMKTYPSVLSIAGFDGSGGAGIQADIKTISALGGYATTVLTALPVQNTMGVKSIFPIPPKVVQEQLETIAEDILPSAIKIGMVYSADLIEIIANFLNDFPEIPVVFDPVMASTSGKKLFSKETNELFIKKLFPRVSILTPNIDEASLLTNQTIQSVETMEKAGRLLLDMGIQSLLLKGGHLQGEQLTSLFFDTNKCIHRFDTQKIHSQNTHGTGCTLSSAIAAYLALEKTPLEAVTLAQDYVYKAIFYTKNIQWGKGNGALHHFFIEE